MLADLAPDIFGAELAQTSNSALLVSGSGSQPAPGFTSQVDQISGQLGIWRAPSMFNSHMSRASSISGSQSLAAGDDDDSQDSYETPTPTPGPSRKREAADSLPSTAKKTCLSSGSQAIGLIGAAMDRFTEAMIDVIAPPPPVVQPGIPMMSASTSNVIGTPRSLRWQVALARVQDEALTIDDRVDLFEIFKKDSVLAESYLAFTIPELRENWIKRKLNALQGYV
ncbi:hypothetical protein BDP27DRAFT_1273479 [Rhodocollybia butyracea]|uniref:Uncharacterized protein n=1 Tax=Rhodocollybia butyracea TaxID=206335 RepID=A0A9P5TZU8_9AGAR|nr:hypothetical protein BDP27DRAFT_1273479 [Rhodocollybia butyracea]